MPNPSLKPISNLRYNFMKPHLTRGICVLALLLPFAPSPVHARDITAPELATFLGVSSWETTVSLPPNSYTINICPIEDGKIGEGIFPNQDEWSKDPDGRFTIIAGPNGGGYRITMSSKTAGTYGVSPGIPTFEATINPALPRTVTEGVYILSADMVGRNRDGNQNDPATYKRGFVLKVAKKQAL